MTRCPESEVRAPRAPVDDCFRAGQQLFPLVAIDAAQFSNAWTKFGRADELPEQARAEEFLRLTCLVDAPGAVQTLETAYLAPLRTVLARRTRDDELVAETLQCVRQKLLVGSTPRLADYTSTGHLHAWLQVVAVRTCQDLARQRGVRWAREAPLAEHFIAPNAAPETLLLKGEFEELFVAVLKDAVRALPKRERYALRMHVLAGWNVDQIGEALATHRATAARWVASAKQRLNDGLRAALQQRLQVSTAEVEHLFSLLNTQLELRLSQIFNATPTPTAGELGPAALSRQAARSEP
jgi:RNA polymerase sigma-70 factor, ECF subfamily